MIIKTRINIVIDVITRIWIYINIYGLIVKLVIINAFSKFACDNEEEWKKREINQANSEYEVDSWMISI